MLVYDAYQMYLRRQESRGLSPSTLTTCRDRIGRLVEKHRTLPLADLSGDHINDHFDDLKRAGLSVGTLAGHKRTLTAWLNWLVEEELLDDNPGRVLRDNKRHRYHFRPVNRPPAGRSDLLALVDALPHFAAHRDYNPRDVRDAALVALAADSAARRGELRNLRRRAIEEALKGGESGGGRTIYTVQSHGKTGQVALHFAEETAAMIRRWLKVLADNERFRYPPPFLFVSLRSGLRLRADSMRLGLNRICDFAGVERVGWHAIRKRTVTDILSASGDPKLAQTWANHADLRTTMSHYLFVDDDQLVSAAAQLADQRWGRSAGADLADQLFGKVGN